MKFKYAEPISVFLIIFVMLFNAIGMAVDAFGYDMDDLPQGKFLYSVMSPDGKNTFSLYLVEIEDVNTAIRGEIASINDEDKIEKENIYWQIGAKTAIAGWKDENTITVNDQELKLDGEPYDSRTQIILPEHSAKNRTINSK
ncbi:MAG: hypothetical protein J6B88_05515 [Clostridia bacterium]|nr:hypothetical protein [Clostridia bacterium]